jgi:hypothetical protein
MLEYGAEELDEMLLDVLVDEWAGHTQRQFTPFLVEGDGVNGRKPSAELLLLEIVSDHP